MIGQVEKLAQYVVEIPVPPFSCYEKNKCEECVLVRDHVILSKFSYSYGMCVNQGREERRRRSERSDKVPIKRLRPGLQAHDGRGSACGCHTAWLWQRRE